MTKNFTDIYSPDGAETKLEALMLVVEELLCRVNRQEQLDREYGLKLFRRITMIERFQTRLSSQTKLITQIK